MTVDIYSETFLVFYKLLLDKGKLFLPIEDREKREYKTNSFKLWDSKIAKGNLSVMNKVMAPATYAGSYWNDRKSKHNRKIEKHAAKKNNAPAFLSEQASPIIIALKFLGYKAPKKLLKKLSEKEEAEFLYLLFLKKECKDFFTEFIKNGNQTINSAEEDKNAQKLLNINSQNQIRNINSTSPDGFLHHNSTLIDEKFEGEIRQLITDIFQDLNNNNIKNLKEKIYCFYGETAKNLMQCEGAHNIEIFNIKKATTFEKHFYAYADVFCVSLECFHTSERLEDFKRCTMTSGTIPYREFYEIVEGGVKLCQGYDLSKITYDDIVSSKDVTFSSPEFKKMITRFLPDVKHRAVAKLFKYKLEKKHNRWEVITIDNMLDLSKKFFQMP